MTRSGAGALLWPFARFAEALPAAAKASGLTRGEVPAPPLPPALRTERASFALYPAAERWVQHVARVGGFDAQTGVLRADEVAAVAGGAAVLGIIGDDGVSLLVTLPRRRRGPFRVLTPGGDEVALSRRALRELVAPALASRPSPWQGRVAAALGDAPGRAGAPLAGLAAEQGVAPPAAFGWMLRPLPSAPLAALLRDGGLGPLLARTIAYAFARSALTTGALVALGAAVLAGRLDRGRLAAWALAAAAAVPVHLLLTRAQSELSLALSVVTRRRLLEGALRLDPDEVRRRGAGSLLAVTNESQRIDALAIGLGFSLLTGAFDAAGAAALLAWGPHGAWLVALFALSALGLAWAARATYARKRQWSDARIGLTNDLVAKMVGHRTRVAQQGPAHWHRGEDDALYAYGRASRAMDLAALPLRLGARGWAALGFGALGPALLEQTPPEALFVGVAGVLLSAQALHTVAGALLALVEAGSAWATVRGVFAAAAALGRPPAAEAAAHLAARADERAPLVDVVDVTFRYAPRGRAVLDGCALRVRKGERVLLEGPSGGGKSTLAALITGLRRPDAGLVLVAGFDQYSLSPEAWREVVAAAPQFHENHVLANTLAFNLLMGRNWPPMPGDLEACEALCEELGLGPLVERMPSGLHQPVGETGWQLSHGERSRVYLARALLQRAELVVLDESFGALDPETLERCMAAALRRAGSLIVIAHP
ncbi:MAG TPA: ATP-binding cassette domain-containing protein [Polyangiaceae bacterium]|nr:ATP-binding cassette domain-containing protein [Polyangiaceae bacterium]